MTRQKTFFRRWRNSLDCTGTPVSLQRPTNGKDNARRCRRSLLTAQWDKVAHQPQSTHKWSFSFRWRSSSSIKQQQQQSKRHQEEHCLSSNAKTNTSFSKTKRFVRYGFQFLLSIRSATLLLSRETMMISQSIQRDKLNKKNEGESSISEAKESRKRCLIDIRFVTSLENSTTEERRGIRARKSWGKARWSSQVVAFKHIAPDFHIRPILITYRVEFELRMNVFVTSRLSIGSRCA